VKCQKVVEDTLGVLRLMGVDERRLRLKWISASEGAIFAEEIRSFTRLLQELGRSPLATSQEAAAQGAAAG